MCCLFPLLMEIVIFKILTLFLRLKPELGLKNLSRFDRKAIHFFLRYITLACPVMSVLPILWHLCAVCMFLQNDQHFYHLVLAN